MNGMFMNNIRNRNERMQKMEKSMEKIVALAKSRGFVYPGSEIYGGLANTWDYGNLGVELKNNVKKAWWQKFIQESPYNVGVDCAILMNPQTWVASGHLGGFSDPLMDCRECHERFRADKIIEDFAEEHDIDINGSAIMDTAGMEIDFICQRSISILICIHISNQKF
jgi:glycyl-tRNA synthetase